jgi:hypothetical protein
VQRITSVTWPVTVCDLCCSLVVTGGIRRVTGGVRVSFPGLSKRFTAIVKSLIGVIDRSRDKGKVFYLRLPVGPMLTNDRTSRRATTRPWESPHAFWRTASKLWPTR